MHSQFEFNNTCTTLHSQMHLQDQSLHETPDDSSAPVYSVVTKEKPPRASLPVVNKKSNQASGSHNIQVYTKASLVHQEQDMQLTQNQAYVTSASVSMKPNECYGTTTPSMDSDLLYATVEGEHNTMHTHLPGAKGKRL